MPRDLSVSDEQLLAASTHTDDALAEYYRRNERIMLAFFVRRVRDSELASDLAATTFLEVVKSHRAFKGREPGDAAAWLFGVAHHTLQRHWRRERAETRRRERLLRELPALTHEQAAEIDLLGEEGPLLVALEHLPQGQRDAVRAYVLDDRSYDEIARQSQIEPSTARKRVSRGIGALREASRNER